LTTSKDLNKGGAPKKIEKKYNTRMSCGECISGGFIYCHKASTKGAEVDKKSNRPQGICCANSTNCTYLNDSNYNCSNTYDDLVLAKRICPFIKSNCGDAKEIEFDSVGEN
jgi:hypothetical protein